MTYLFMGMIIGGILRIIIGGLSVAVKSAEKEIRRLKNDVEVKRNV